MCWADSAPRSVIAAWASAEHGQQDEPDQDPRHRVAWLVPGDNHANPGVDKEYRDSGPDAEKRELMDQFSQDHIESRQGHGEDAEHRGRPR